MRIDVLTLFPAMITGPLSESILGRAQDAKHIDLHVHDLRQWGFGTHRQVDDTPYGGGAGMLMRVDVVVPALEAIVEKGKAEGMKADPLRIFLAPAGTRLEQAMVEQIAEKTEWMILLCGHYEGIDQRIIEGGWIDESISIGDYVLTGGELPAMVLIDAVARHLPGVLGHDASKEEESFSPKLDRKREYPHYTKPAEFRGLTVPDVLVSGHHKNIEDWRKSQLS